MQESVLSNVHVDQWYIDKMKKIKPKWKGIPEKSKIIIEEAIIRSNKKIKP